MHREVNKMNASVRATRKNAAEYSEAARMLCFLRAIGTEEQRIAYAVLEGMRLQKRIDEQSAPRQGKDGV